MNKSPLIQKPSASRRPSRLTLRADDLSMNEILAVENELNHRPRFVLNDRAPAELFGRCELASKNRPCCDVD